LMTFQTLLTSTLFLLGAFLNKSPTGLGNPKLIYPIWQPSSEVDRQILNFSPYNKLTMDFERDINGLYHSFSLEPVSSY
jgi:hypothetical protein